MTKPTCPAANMHPANKSMEAYTRVKCEEWHWPSQSPWFLHVSLYLRACEIQIAYRAKYALAKRKRQAPLCSAGRQCDALRTSLLASESATLKITDTVVETHANQWKHNYQLLNTSGYWILAPGLGMFGLQWFHWAELLTAMPMNKNLRSGHRKTYRLLKVKVQSC